MIIMFFLLFFFVLLFDKSVYGSDIALLKPLNLANRSKLGALF